MATVLAVDIYDNRAKVLALQAEPGERVLILRSGEVAMPGTEPHGQLSPENESTEQTAGENGSGHPLGAIGSEGESDSGLSSGSFKVTGTDILAVFSDLEIDATFAVSASSHILYSQLTFPFRDQKKIEQVAPIQVQDS